MDNIEYLRRNIDEVKDIISDLEGRMNAGEQSLDMTLHTFQRHLNDLRKQLAEATKPALVG